MDDEAGAPGCECTKLVFTRWELSKLGLDPHGWPHLLECVMPAGHDGDHFSPLPVHSWPNLEVGDAHG